MGTIYEKALNKKICVLYTSYYASIKKEGILTGYYKAANTYYLEIDNIMYINEKYLVSIEIL